MKIIKIILVLLIFIAFILFFFQYRDAFKMVSDFWCSEDKFVGHEVNRIGEEYPYKQSISVQKIIEWQNTTRERVTLLKETICKSVKISFCLLILGSLLAYVLSNKKYRLNLRALLGLISAFLILMGTYGQLGWEIQTINGNSHIEMVNKYWFRGMFGLGMFLLFASILVNRAERVKRESD